LHKTPFNPVSCKNSIRLQPKNRQKKEKLIPKTTQKIERYKQAKRLPSPNK
jgi:hypothetical protein